MATAAATAPPAATSAPYSPRHRDRARLLFALIKFLGENQDTIATNPLVHAFELKGVYTFNQFTTLKKDDFETLVQDDPSNPGNMIPFPTYTVCLLQALLAIYHYVSGTSRKSTKIQI